jgi:putative Ca2+/H+ antiporter (TMEM165/GDT1 family)
LEPILIPITPILIPPETVLEIGLKPQILEQETLESKILKSEDSLKPQDSLELEDIAESRVGELASSVTSQKLSLNQEIQVFASTFLTVLLAELGDKTQMTTLLLSAQSQNPWVVFAGAGTALVLTSLLGVLMGRWLAGRVSQQTLKTLTGTLLLLISVLLLWDVVQL